LRARINDDNTVFLEVLKEGMKVLKVDTTACIILALEEEETDHLAMRIGGEEKRLTFVFHGGKCVEKRTAVRLNEG